MKTDQTYSPPQGPFARGGRWLLVALCIASLCATGCFRLGSGRTDSSGKASGSKGPRGTKPYTIRGKTYYPLLSAHGFRENGTASWYGPDFHGKLTANGERYNMHGMTAAHKLLPFGTQVKVTNKSNGRSIVVRINDRGPFVADRVIDLTRTGADRLGMLGPGTAPVVVESIGTVPGLKDGDLMGRFYVQVGAFGVKNNAEKLVSRFSRQGQPARTVYAADVSLWRVQVGPFPSLNHAEDAATRLQGEFPSNFTVTD